jgi:hypothetical protein
MQANWKKPWTVLSWMFSREDFTPEEDPGTERASRFGPGGFLKWLFASEEFVEEPEMGPEKPRFGDRGFFAWLFLSDRRELLEGETDTEAPKGQDDEEKTSP